MDGDKDVELWERQPDETPKAWEAFCVYRDMGADRSIAKAGRKLGKNRVTLENWSSKYEWVKRCAAWDAELERIARKEQIEEIKKMRRRHAKLAVNILDKVEAALAEMDSEAIKAANIPSMVETAAKLERISRGDAGEVIEERDGGKAISPVQIYVPDNNRGRDKDTFDDLEV